MATDSKSVERGAIPRVVLALAGLGLVLLLAASWRGCQN